MADSSGLLEPVSNVMLRCQRQHVSTVNASTAAVAAVQHPSLTGINLSGTATHQRHILTTLNSQRNDLLATIQSR
jgi:Mg2+/citrate symporter